MDNVEIAILVFFTLGMSVIVGLAFMSIKTVGVHISYGHESDPNCEHCHGTGIVADDDCPCTMRVRNC